MKTLSDAFSVLVQIHETINRDRATYATHPHIVELFARGAVLETAVKGYKGVVFNHGTKEMRLLDEARKTRLLPEHAALVEELLSGLKNPDKPYPLPERGVCIRHPQLKS